RPEIEEIRGVDCGAVVKALLERRLVRILGKKEEIGRPLLYGTTREFLEFFGLESLSALPTLREFQELNEENRSIVEQETGEAVAPIAGIADLADGALARRLDESLPESDDALLDLEAAMAEAEARAKLVHAQLEPVKPPERSGDSLASADVPS
ncbi:MAG: SMC-Scp complex subunit ScpB, partial [Deltaproteobacteria bacterium]